MSGKDRAASADSPNKLLEPTFACHLLGYLHSLRGAKAAQLEP